MQAPSPVDGYVRLLLVQLHSTRWNSPIISTLLMDALNEKELQGPVGMDLWHTAEEQT